MSQTDVEALQKRLLDFARARDWEQFHTPKNLAMALSVEAAELLEHFQWLTPEQSAQLAPDKLHDVALEMADIFIYLLRLAERLDVNLVEAAAEKIALNEKRYPAGQVRGSARKYSDYD